jgi:hypothetical protein
MIVADRYEAVIVKRSHSGIDYVFRQYIVSHENVHSAWSICCVRRGNRDRPSGLNVNRRGLMPLFADAP